MSAVASSAKWPCVPCGDTRSVTYHYRPEDAGGSYLRCRRCSRVWSVAEYGEAVAQAAVSARAEVARA